MHQIPVARREEADPVLPEVLVAGHIHTRHTDIHITLPYTSTHTFTRTRQMAGTVRGEGKEKGYRAVHERDHKGQRDAEKRNI